MSKQSEELTSAFYAIHHIASAGPSVMRGNSFMGYSETITIIK